MHFKATLQIIACDLSVAWFSSAPANCEQSESLFMKSSTQQGKLRFNIQMTGYRFLWFLSISSIVTQRYLAGVSKLGVLLIVSAIVVLLLAIALGYSFSLINRKQNKPTDEFHKDEAKGWLILDAYFCCTICYCLFSPLKKWLYYVSNMLKLFIL